MGYDVVLAFAPVGARLELPDRSAPRAHWVAFSVNWTVDLAPLAPIPRSGARLRCDMTDRATPNLPARDLVSMSGFYAKLGFTEDYRDDGWMILRRGGLTLEFFPFPGLDPSTNSFGCCLRLDDVDDFYAVCRAAGLPETAHGWPRIHPPRRESSGMRIGALIDPDGSLLRLVQNG